MRMKRWLVIVAVMGTLCIGAGGCPERKGTLTEKSEQLNELIEDGKEKSEEAIKLAAEATETLNRILDRANDPTPMELPVNKEDPVVEAVKVGADVAKPFVPYPYNYLLLLIPALAGWLRAETVRKKREMEEALLIQSLQKLKKEDRPAFDKIMEYRDMVGKNLMTVKQFASRLDGILAVKAKYLPQVDRLLGNSSN